MNADKFATFSAAYRSGLLAAVIADADKPEEKRHYNWSADNVPIVADKMLKSIAEKPLGVNYDSNGFKRACKLLGIKPTRKAIFAYLEIA